MGKIWPPITEEVYFTNLVNSGEIASVKNHLETFLVVQWLRLCAPSTGGPGSVRVRELDLACCSKDPVATTRAWDGQTAKSIF